MTKLNKWAFFSVVLVLYIFIYSRAIFGKYMLADDYSFFVSNLDFNDFLLPSQGRVFGYSFMYLVSLFIKEIDQMWIIRIVAPIIYSLTSVCTFNFMRKLDYEPAISLFISVGIFLLPPSFEMVTFAVSSQATVAILLSLLSVKSTIENRTRLAIFYLVSANLFYQPAAMCYWLFAMIIVCSKKTTNTRQLRTTLISGIIGTLLYFCIFMLLKTYGTKVWPIHSSVAVFYNQDRSRVGNFSGDFILHILKTLWGFALGAFNI